MKKFLKTNGYYLILIVCVFAVCIAGIAILENSSKADPTLQTNKEPTSADMSQTTMPQSTDSQQSSANGGSTSVSKPVKPSETPQGTAEPEKLTMIKPVSGKILTQFSDKKLVYNKTLKEWKVHPAIDIAGQKGEDVKCAMTGTVTDIKSDPLYGTTIIIDNGSGTKTVYCGIAAMNDLTVGKKVTAGSVLGTLGDTIFCEKDLGAHLHFEVVQNSKKIDPSLFFPKETSADASDEENSSTTTPSPSSTSAPVTTPAPTSTMNILQPTATSVG